MLQKLLSSYCAWRLRFCSHYLHAWNFETHANLGSVGALESCQSFEEPCTGAAISKGWCLLQIPRRDRYKPLPTPLCSGKEYANTVCLQRLTQTWDLSSAGSWEAFLVLYLPTAVLSMSAIPVLMYCQKVCSELGTFFTAIPRLAYEWMKSPWHVS
jgi:hypothetical protein